MIKLKQSARTLFCAGFTAIALVGAAPARSATLVENNNTGVVGSISSSGTFTPIFTPTTPLPLTDIAVDSSGNLFGITFNELYKLNTTNNTATLIGSTGQAVNGLSFDQNNNLYATGISGFFKVDINSGAATKVGDANASGFRSAGDITFNPSTNSFFATSNNPNDSTLFSINLEGGARSIGSIGASAVYGLALDGTNLFGYTFDGKELSINQTNGQGTFIRNIIGNTAIGGAASFSSPVPPVQQAPEPFTIIGTLVGGTAAVRMRRKLKSTGRG
jgi:hypothetical protein